MMAQALMIIFFSNRLVKKKTISFWCKGRPDSKITDELQAIHGDTYNRIQYKLWAQAMDVKKHKSMERPPAGTILGHSKDSERSHSTLDAVNKAFTNIANTLATVLNKPHLIPPTNCNLSAMTKDCDVSPDQLADLQGKFVSQID